MECDLRIDILGPLRVTVAGQPVQINGQRGRVILAALALSPGAPVSAGTLADYVWGESPPAQERPALHTAVTRLRQTLGLSVIVGAAGSYTLTSSADAVDVHRFRSRVAAARSCGDPAQELSLLDEALAGWRGEPLEDVHSDRLVAELTPRLTEEWFAAMQWHIDLKLAAGEHVDVVARLQDLTARYPYRESSWCRLMTALYRSGRQADALAAYHQARRLLRDGLGIEPGSELQAAHRAVLAGEASMGATPATTRARWTPTGRPQPAAPRQVPSDITTFTGRAEQLAILDALLPDDATGVGASTSIAAVCGVGGVGKTALAVHWAHRMADRFPDGQLYTNLRGYGPGDPIEPAAALASLLQTLDTPPERIPADLDARAAQLRTALAGKRVLMLLDDVLDEAQVRPLLPGPDTFVLVTSRSQLRGLAVCEGARRVTLPHMAEDESVALLASLLGDRSTVASPAARELAQLCGHLPLALAIAAERATRSAGRRLSDVVAELREQRRRLDLLRTGADVNSDMRAVFSWSYQALTPAMARLFRLLALLPGVDTTAQAAAALAGIEAAEANRLLDGLVAAHQLQERLPGRYEQHQLVGTYAAELVEQHDDERQRCDARRRVLDWYLHTARNARDRLRSTPLPIRGLEEPSDGVIPLTFVDRLEALAWLDAECDNLTAAAEYASAHAEHRHAWQLAALVRTYLNVYRPWEDTVAMHRHALRSARLDGDRFGEATALSGLGDAHHCLGQHEKSLRLSRQAMTIYREFDDHAGEAGMLTNVGMTLELLGRPEEAIASHRQALVVASELDNRAADAAILNNLASAYVAAGDYEAALDAGHQGLAASRATASRQSEADILDELGRAYAGLGRYSAAIEHYRGALAIYRETRNPMELATLIHLGHAHHAADDRAEAVETWRAALRMASELNDGRATELRELLAPFERTGTDTHEETGTTTGGFTRHH